MSIELLDEPSQSDGAVSSLLHPLKVADLDFLGMYVQLKE